MARRNNDIFAAPRKRSGLGLLILVALIIAALAAAGLFLNKAANQRIALSSEKVPVMGLDKTYEGFMEVIANPKDVVKAVIKL